MSWPTTIGHPEKYFTDRFDIIDTRGTIAISPESAWGYYITVLTYSHKVADGILSAGVDRPVIVEPRVWICSCSVLYNCIIREGAVVALGSVVKSCEVKPWTMVAGNPAKVVAHWKDGEWHWLEPRWRVLE